jgi:hypothetical protein
MKSLVVFLVLACAGASPLTAQGNDSFTEAELFTAFHWKLPDSTARNYARLFAAEDPAVQATIPELRDVGPFTPNYNADFLLLISLVSPEANRKAQRYLRDLYGERDLTADERAKWEAKREQVRKALISEGKLPKG